MIDDYLFCDWDEAPGLMDFELTYGEAIDRCADLVEGIQAFGPDGQKNPASWKMAEELFVTAPAIINVALNYRICVDFGLELHPTQYFELNAAGAKGIEYAKAEIDAAEVLYASSISLARAAYRLSPVFREQANVFRKSLPGSLENFVYTSRRDKYTWRAAEPAKVRSLVTSIMKHGRPKLAIGAAHGSIMAGVLLAEILCCRLWFLRFSMFKRQDKAPVISGRDEEFIRSFGSGSSLLVFDEDSASGTTLSILTERIRLIAPEVRSGAVIRHATSGFRPDYVGRTWWD